MRVIAFKISPMPARCRRCQRRRRQQQQQRRRRQWRRRRQRRWRCSSIEMQTSDFFQPIFLPDQVKDFFTLSFPGLSLKQFFSMKRRWVEVSTQWKKNPVEKDFLKRLEKCWKKILEKQNSFFSTFTGFRICCQISDQLVLIRCKRNIRWQHLPEIKGRSFFKLKGFFSGIKMHQSIFGTSWWMPICWTNSSALGIWAYTDCVKAQETLEQKLLGHPLLQLGTGIWSFLCRFRAKNVKERCLK